MSLSTVTCPPGCLADTTEVIGSGGKYSDASSICRAAMHAGVIDDNGGPCTVQIGESIAKGDKYMPAEAGGIESEGAEGPNKVSFNVIKAPVEPCPNEENEKREKAKEKRLLSFL